MGSKIPTFRASLSATYLFSKRLFADTQVKQSFNFLLLFTLLPQYQMELLPPVTMSQSEGATWLWADPSIAASFYDLESTSILATVSSDSALMPSCLDSNPLKRSSFRMAWDRQHELDVARRLPRWNRAPGQGLRASFAVDPWDGKLISLSRRGLPASLRVRTPRPSRPKSSFRPAPTRLGAIRFFDFLAAEADATHSASSIPESHLLVKR